MFLPLFAEMDCCSGLCLAIAVPGFLVLAFFLFLAVANPTAFMEMMRADSLAQAERRRLAAERRRHSFTRARTAAGVAAVVARIFLGG